VISFRYHLVSIVAVFLALALGIVVGTTALSGPITKDLRNQLDDTRKQRNDLAGQVKQLQQRVDDAGQFASTYGSQLVAGSLTKKNVVMVVLPGVSSGMQNGIARQIAAAGGKVGGTVSLTQNYLDAKLGGSIISLATGQYHPNDWTAPEGTHDPRVIGGSLLAFVLLGKGQPTDLTQVLGQFSALHMVTLSSGTVSPSNLVVVVGHGSRSKGDYGIGAEADLVSAMAKDQGRVVVAGDEHSAGGGVVAAVRGSDAMRSAVSTVDDADNAFGQVSSVLAVSAAGRGEFGHYGTQNGADALFPSPSK
jgi:hypothetical protein